MKACPAVFALTAAFFLGSAQAVWAAGVPISSVAAYGISGALNGWNHTHGNGQACNEDTSFMVQINTPQSWDYDTMHYFYTARTGWISSGWIHHSSPSSNQYVWNSAFAPGEVVRTYGITRQNGVLNGVWGPTFTVATATDESKNPVSDDLLKFVGGKIGEMLTGQLSFGIPYQDLIEWGFGFAQWNVVTAEFAIQAVDDGGNPLQSTLNLDWPNYVKTFDGNAVFSSNDNDTNPIGDGYELIVTQPNGPGSFDGNLHGRTATLGFRKYNYAVSNHAWGTPVNRLPLITVVFKKDGTTELLEPAPYSWDIYYDADALPAISSPSWNLDLAGATQSVSRGVLTLSGGSSPAYWLTSLPYESMTIETLVKVNSGVARLKFRNTSNKGSEIDLDAESPAKWRTLRVTLTSSECKYYVDGVYRGTAPVSDATGWWPIMFGAQGSSNIQWDYVVIKNGVYPLPRTSLADDFSDLNYTANPTWTNVTDWGVGGYLDASSGALEIYQTADAGNSARTASATAYGTWQLDFKLGSRGGCNYTRIIWYFIENGGSYYYVRVQDTRNRIEIGDQNGVLASSDFSPPPGGPWYTLKITRDRSGQFRVYINGALQLTATDNVLTTSSTTRIGAYRNCGRADIFVDNIIVGGGDFPSCPAISLSPTSLPEGTVGAAYGQTITASGGAAPYEYSVTSGTLPVGLTLSSGGVLSGTPAPTTAGGYTFAVMATDATGCTATKGYSMTIAPSGGWTLADDFGDLNYTANPTWTNVTDWGGGGYLDASSGALEVYQTTDAGNGARTASTAAYGTWELDFKLGARGGCDHTRLLWYFIENPSSYYYVKIERTANMIWFGNQSGLLASTPFVSQLGKWYHLTITRDTSGVFEVSIDGVSQLTATDNSITQSTTTTIHAQRNCGFADVFVDNVLISAHPPV